MRRRPARGVTCPDAMQRSRPERGVHPASLRPANPLGNSPHPRPRPSRSDLKFALRSPAACARARHYDSRMAAARAPGGRAGAPDLGFALRRLSAFTSDRADCNETPVITRARSHSRFAAVLSHESRKLAQILARPVRSGSTLMGAPDTCATNESKLNHSPPGRTPDETTPSGTPVPLRNGEAGPLLDPAER